MAFLTALYQKVNIKILTSIFDPSLIFQAYEFKKPSAEMSFLLSVISFRADLL
jgi:hypothetical protein